MLYTLAVLKEALRKYSVVPVVTRQLAADDELLGHKLPRGIMVACILQVSLHVLGRSCLPLGNGLPEHPVLPWKPIAAVPWGCACRALTTCTRSRAPSSLSDSCLTESTTSSMKRTGCTSLCLSSRCGKALAWLACTDALKGGVHAAWLALA